MILYRNYVGKKADKQGGMDTPVWSMFTVFDLHKNWSLESTTIYSHSVLVILIIRPEHMHLVGGAIISSTYLNDSALDSLSDS